MKKHELKTDPIVFAETWSGKKNFEVRVNDRDFQVGDALDLWETSFTGEEMKKGSSLIYTGRYIEVEVEYILHGPIYGLAEGWVIMATRFITRGTKDRK